MFHFFKKVKHFELYILWLFMFLFVFDYHYFEGNWFHAMKYTSIEILTYILVFHLNYNFALPQYLDKNKALSYIILVMLSLFTYIFIIKMSGVELSLYEGGFYRNLYSMIINFSLFWLISTLFWHYQKGQKEREMRLHLRADKLETEMRFLKNQISPHFIFNTLNNIYSLVQQNHKNAGPMLAKLSGILRYILYDSAKENVILVKEIDTIRQYVELQELRKPKSKNIDFYLEGNASTIKIVPLLLINFVENCFKHSNIDKSEEGWIKISCIIKEGNQLIFSTENSKDKNRTISKDGLGNSNIKRQLKLSYPGQYKLEIMDKEDIYTLNLEIKL